MPTAIKIVIIDDDEDWIADLSEFITNNFAGVHLEPFTDFTKAENRLTKKKLDFDLLITDIFPSNESKRTKGFELARLVIARDIPVIIVTGVSDFVVNSFREIKVSDAFDKGSFEPANFIEAVRKALQKKEKKNGTPGDESPKGWI